jgi:hypothetical protein
MRAKYFVSLRDRATQELYFVGPFADHDEALAARNTRCDDSGMAFASAGFVTGGVHTTSDAKSIGMREWNLLGDRMPTTPSDFSELVAYATMMR